MLAGPTSQNLMSLAITLVPCHALLETLDRIRVLAVHVPDFRHLLPRCRPRSAALVRSYLKAQVSVHGNDDARRPNHTAVPVRYAARVSALLGIGVVTTRIPRGNLMIARDRGGWSKLDMRSGCWLVDCRCPVAFVVWFLNVEHGECGPAGDFGAG